MRESSQSGKPDQKTILTDVQNNESFKFASTVMEETTIIFKLYFQIVFQNLCIYLPTSTANIYIGHLPNNAQLMAGSALARSFTEVTATSVAWGLNNALKTLIPQAIGDNKKELISIYFQRSVLINIVLNIPLSIIQFYAGNLMCLINEPQDLCTIASTYCKYLIPFLWFYSLFTQCQRVGQTVKLNDYVLYSSLISAVISFPLNYLLVFTLNLGYIGTAITVDICVLISCIILIYALCLKGYGFIFKPLPLSIICTYDGIKQYLYLAIPGVFNTMSTWWTGELFILLSGYVYNPKVASSSSAILYGFDLTYLSFQYSMNTAVAVRVGKYIGAKSIKYAKRSFWCGLFVIYLISIPVALVVVIFNNKIPLLWGIGNNPDILYYTSILFYVEAMKVLVWSGYHSCLGLLYGLGLAHYGAYIVVITMWIINLPNLFILLKVLNWRLNTLYGLLAIWGVPVICAFLAFILIIIIVFCYVDFNEVVRKSTMRIKETAKDYEYQHYELV